jgi:hypothetical protein
MSVGAAMLTVLAPAKQRARCSSWRCCGKWLYHALQGDAVSAAPIHGDRCAAATDVTAAAALSSCVLYNVMHAGSHAAYDSKFAVVWLWCVLFHGHLQSCSSVQQLPWSSCALLAVQAGA